MRVLLIKPPNQRIKIIVPSLGLGYLATALRQKDCEVVILDCLLKKMDDDDLRDYLKANQGKFAMIGWQVFSCDLGGVKRGLVLARKYFPKAILVAGGPHVSALPRESYHYFSPEIDYLLIGEAEEALRKLVAWVRDKRGKKKNISGLVYREKGGIRFNKPACLENLDRFGVPAWDLMAPNSFPPFLHGGFYKQWPAAPIITSRGCPFNCAFCGAKTVSGKKLRYRSLALVRKEIELLIKKYGVKEIQIEDDNFTFNKDYVESFCKYLITARLGISWSCPNGVRVDSLDKDLLRLMKKAGCYSLAIGIESGSVAILKRMNKRIRKNQVRRVVKTCHQLGIKTTGFFIIGFPGEKRRDIRETIGLALQLELDRACFANFFPLPGAEIFYKLEKEGKVKSVAWESCLLNSEIVNSYAELAVRELRWWQKTATLVFYLRPRILLGIAKEVSSWSHFKYLFFRAKEILW